MSWQFSFVHEWLLRKNILGLLTVPTIRKLEAYDGRAKRSCQVQHAHMYASKISTAVPVTKRVFWWTKSRAACGHQSQYQIINAQKGHQILTTDGGNDGSVVLVRCRIGARTTCGFTLDKIRTALPKAPWQGRLRSKKRSPKSMAYSLCNRIGALALNASSNAFDGWNGSVRRPNQSILVVQTLDQLVWNLDWSNW